MRILVVTTEPVALPGFAPTGAGLRAWALAEGLRGRGFDVEVAMAEDAANGVADAQRRKAAPFLFARERLTEHVRARHPDVLVMQHWGLMNRLADIDCPLAIDLAGPHLLERRFWGSPAPERDLQQKMSALARADFLTCSGRFQRHYFLGFALAAGFAADDPGLLPVIPFSMSPELAEAPAERTPDDLVYAGFLLPWQDPAVAVQAALETLARRGLGRLRFVGGRHPSGDVSRGRFDSLLKNLDASPQALLEPPRPFAELTAMLTRCGVALDAMAPNAERELAFPSRTVVYLWCGLPVIHHDFDELAPMIREAEAGWVVDPLDPEAVATAVARALDDPAETARRGENARRLVQERLTWDRTIEPLAGWCRAPKRRESARPLSDADARVAALTARFEASEAELAEMRGRRLVRFSSLLRRLGLHR